MLDNFSLIIPTYNRYSFLQRNIEFYLSYNLNFNIIILDSSTKKITEQVKSLLINNNIKLIKFSDSIKPIEKILIGMKDVKTEFCAISADDDFLIPSTFKKYINFLSKNSKYASVHGLYFNHREIEFNSKKYFVLDQLYSNKANSNDDNDPINRIKNYLNGKCNYYPFYAITRSNYLKNIIYNTNKFSKNITFDEYLFNILSLKIGKMKVFNDLYCSKQINYFNWTNQSKIYNFFDEVSKKNFLLGVTKNLVLEDSIQKSFLNYLDNWFVSTKEKALLRIKNNLLIEKNQNQLNKNFLKYFIFKIKLFLRSMYLYLYLGCNLEDKKKIEKYLKKFDNIDSELISARNTYI